MISKKMSKALTEQINKEMYSGYLYMAMSSYSGHLGLKGCAHWFMTQYKEEMEHARKMYNYLQDQGEHVHLLAIDKPQAVYASALDMFEKTLEHERVVTKSINALVDLAIKENDHATNIFLQWFVTEQVEEEAHASEIIDKLKMVGEKGHGLFMIDRMLGERK
jgi:ferritin